LAVVITAFTNVMIKFLEEVFAMTLTSVLVAVSVLLTIVGLVSTIYMMILISKL